MNLCVHFVFNFIKVIAFLQTKHKRTWIDALTYNVLIVHFFMQVGKHQVCTENLNRLLCRVITISLCTCDTNWWQIFGHREIDVLSQFIHIAVPFMFDYEDSSTTFVKNDLLKQPSGNKYYDDEFFHLNILIFHTEQMYKDIVFLH